MGELLALRWRDVEFAGQTIRVLASYYAGQLTTPKSGKVRAVPMAPDVASAIAQLGGREDWIGDDDLVFAGETGGYLDGSALRRQYKVALQAAALRSLRFHDRSILKNWVHSTLIAFGHQVPMSDLFGVAGGSCSRISTFPSRGAVSSMRALR